MNEPRYSELPSFIERRKAWLKEAQANGQETLARVLKDSIERTEEILKNMKQEIKQLTLWN